MDTNALLETPRATILVVDDEPASLSAFGRILRRHYEVLAAPSGSRALEIASGHSKPNLILLDVLMPDMNGFQVLERLQENPLTKEIPVIFVTVLDTLDDHTEGLRAGAVDFIAKPYSPDIVLSRIAAHLALKKMTDELAHAKEVAKTEHQVKRKLLSILEQALRTALEEMPGVPPQTSPIAENNSERMVNIRISLDNARSLLNLIDDTAD